MEGLLSFLFFGDLIFLMKRYGWYFASIWVPLYNIFTLRREAKLKIQ